MASVGLNFANLTPDNGAVRDLRELIFLSVTNIDSLGDLFNFLPKQEHGKKVGLLGQFGLLGKASQGCDPTYGNDLVKVTEKTWDIKRWEIAEGICFEDLLSNLGKTALRTGTSVADLTGTEYLDNIVLPLLESAVKRLVLRIAFFGDKAASVYDKTTNTSGTLKEGANAGNFTITDGFFKHIFDGVAKGVGADGYISRVTIAANNETTSAAQRTAINTSGAATKVIDDLIANAPMQLRQANGQVIYVTQFLADALSADIKRNNKGSELQWKAIFDGIQETTYNGIALRAVPFLDEIIQGYLQNTTNAGAWDKPARAVYTIKDNLLVGTESQSEIADIQTWFDQTKQKNFILCRDTLGTLIADENLITVAY